MSTFFQEASRSDGHAGIHPGLGRLVGRKPCSVQVSVIVIGAGIARMSCQIKKPIAGFPNVSDPSVNDASCHLSFSFARFELTEVRSHNR